MGLVPISAGLVTARTQPCHHGQHWLTSPILVSCLHSIPVLIPGEGHCFPTGIPVITFWNLLVSEAPSFIGSCLTTRYWPFTTLAPHLLDLYWHLSVMLLNPAWVLFFFGCTFMHWRRKWQPTPVFLPGESQGQGSLVGCHLWGSTELDTIEVT